MSRVHMQAVRSPWRSLGWPGFAGSLALAAALYLSVVGATPPESVQRSGSPAPVSSARLDVRTPARPESERLARLLELALQEGVTVLRTEQRARGGGEPGTQLHMPARGGYEELRRFTEAALASDLALALESLRLHRRSEADPTLQAEFVWWIGGDKN